MSKSRRMIYDDDSKFIGAIDPPIRQSDLEGVIDNLGGTPITTYAWCSGTGNLSYHPSDVVDMFGVGLETPYRRELGQSTAVYRTCENVRHMAATGCDPVRVLIDRCRYWGIEFLYDVRMNDMHENAPICAWYRTPFKVAHPELLLGEAGCGVGWVPKDAAEQINWAFDFAHQQVRDLRLAQFEEVIEKYDIDGLSLDFMRGPVYFLPGQAEKNLDKLTDLIHRTRTALNKKADRTGRRLCLLVRVPPYLGGCKQVGLDVATWIKEALVDIVVPASCRRENMNVQASTFVALAKPTGCQVLAGLEHADHYGPLTIEMYRAAAQRYWRAGVDGLYLFNMCCRGPYPHGPEEKQILHEICEPGRIARLDKHYIVPRRWNDAPHERIAEAADPPTTLPYEWGPNPGELTVTVQLDDDFEAACQEDVLQKVTVWVRLTDSFATLDVFSFSWNGQPCEEIHSLVSDTGNGQQWIGLDVTNMQLNTGENVLLIRLIRRADNAGYGVTVCDIEATVQYRARLKWGREQRPKSWYRPKLG